MSTPEKCTPYATSKAAFEDLAKLAELATTLEIRDKYFIGHLERLVLHLIEMKETRLRDYLGRSPIPERIMQAVLEWLTIRRKLVNSFDQEGAAMQKLDEVTKAEALRYICKCFPDEADGRIRYFSICAKVKAVPGLDDPNNSWVDKAVLDTINQQREAGGQPSATGCSDPEPSQQRSLSPSPTSFADERRSLHEQIERLEATILSNERRLEALAIENEELANSAKDLDKNRKLLAQVRQERTAATKANSLLKAEKENLEDRLSAALHEKAILADEKEQIDIEKSGLPESDELIAENKRLQDCLSTALQEKAIMAHEKEQFEAKNVSLTISAEQKEIRRDELNSACDEPARLLEEVKTLFKNLTEGKRDFTKVNAEMEALLSTAVDDHTKLSKIVEELCAEIGKKSLQLDYTLDIMSDLKDQREQWRQQSVTLEEEKADLVAQLADAKETLHQAPSTITALSLDALTEENSRLQEELKVANNMLRGIRASLE